MKRYIMPIMFLFLLVGTANAALTTIDDFEDGYLNTSIWAEVTPTVTEGNNLTFDSGGYSRVRSAIPIIPLSDTQLTLISKVKHSNGDGLFSFGVSTYSDDAPEYNGGLPLINQLNCMLEWNNADIRCQAIYSDITNLTILELSPFEEPSKRYWWNITLNTTGSTMTLYYDNGSDSIGTQLITSKNTLYKLDIGTPIYLWATSYNRYGYLDKVQYDYTGECGSVNIPNISYNSLISQNSNQNITLIFVNNTPICKSLNENLTAILNYNGVPYPTIRKSGIDSVNYTASITASQSTETVNFYFTYYINGTSYNINTINYAQTITEVAIDNCSNYYNISTNATMLNITIRNKNTSSPLTVNTFGISLLSQTLNYSETHYNISNYLLCIYPSGYSINASISSEYTYGSQVFNYYSTDTVLNNITKNINLYIDTSSATSVTATVYNNLNNEIEGAYIYVLQYDWASGNYINVGIYKTNFEGKTTMYLTLNTIYYKFMIYYPQNTLVKTTSPTYIYANTINFQIDTTPPLLEDYYYESGIYANLTFNEQTNNMKFDYSDPSAGVSQGCLKISKQNLLTGNIFNTSSCLSSASGSILLYLDSSESVTYIGEGYVTINGEERTLSRLSKTFYGSENPSDYTGMMGVILLIILTIGFAFVITFSIPLGVIMIPLPAIFLSSIHFIALDLDIAIGLEVAALIIAIIINWRG